jgi:hypothetical protein
MLAHWSLDVFYSLRSRRKHKAWGVSPRMGETMTARAREAGDSFIADNVLRIRWLLSPVSRARRIFSPVTRGSASLHPGLYAAAR